MCGYCTEGGFVLDFIESRNAGFFVELDQNFLSIYLQEAEDLSSILDRLRSAPNLEFFFDIALCRLIEKYLEQGHTNSDYGRVRSCFDQLAVNYYFGKSKHIQTSAAITQLLKSDTYESSAVWAEFIADRDARISDAKRCLETFCSVCLVDDQQANATSSANYPDIMPSNENSYDLHAALPSLYFSLAFLSSINEGWPLIEKIAIGNLRYPPDFTANDLWLQRMAFVACVKFYGMDFILNRYAVTRLELIFYTLLKISFAKTDIQALTDLVISSENHFVVGIDVPALLSLLGKLSN